MQTAGLKKSSAPGCRLSCRSLFVLLFLASTAGTRAQFVYTTNTNGTLNVAQYTDTNSVVVIPSSTNGMAVTSIGEFCFAENTNITSVTIPDSVSNLGGYAFQSCGNLANVSIGNGITNLQYSVFDGCTDLSEVSLGTNVSVIGFDAFRGCGFTNFIFPASVNQIGYGAFAKTKLVKIVIPGTITYITNQTFLGCSNLKTVVIPSSVTNIEAYSFENCVNLSAVYFEGNAPMINSNAFTGDNVPVVGYYLPETTGWTNLPLRISIWNPTIVTANTNFGVQNGQFGFDITNTIEFQLSLSIVIQAATNLAQPVWTQVFAGTIPYYSSGNLGLLHFTDYEWTNYPSRFYRISSP